MKIAVLGAGNVGKVLAENLDSLGHDVCFGTRDPQKTLEREGVSELFASHPKIRNLSMNEAVISAEIVINALSGESCLGVLTAISSDNFAGKILIDISNPLDFSQGFPPTLFVKDTDSLAEQIQRALPRTRVVKTLNTMNAQWMVPRHLEPHSEISAFLSGDDDDAKLVVRGLLESFGHTDILDLGDLSSARAAEMLLPMWLRLSVALGSYSHNFKIVQ